MEGSFPSVVHISIDRLHYAPGISNNIIDGVEQRCNDCDCSWPLGPSAANQKQTFNEKRLDIANFSVYIEEIDDDSPLHSDLSNTNNLNQSNNTSSSSNNNLNNGNNNLSNNSLNNNNNNNGELIEDRKNLKANSTNSRSEVVKNVNIKVRAVFGKLPYPHMHFCSIECEDQLNIHLRDIDLQAFSLMINELKALFTIKTPNNVKKKEEEEEKGFFFIILFFTLIYFI